MISQWFLAFSFLSLLVPPLCLEFSFLINLKPVCMHDVISFTSDSLRCYGLESTRLFCPWDSLGKKSGMGLPCPSPGDLPNPGIKPVSLSLLNWQAGSLPLVPPGEPQPKAYFPLNTNLISISSLMPP